MTALYGLSLQEQFPSLLPISVVTHKTNISLYGSTSIRPPYQSLIHWFSINISFDKTIHNKASNLSFDTDSMCSLYLLMPRVPQTWSGIVHSYVKLNSTLGLTESVGGLACLDLVWWNFGFFGSQIRNYPRRCGSHSQNLSLVILMNSFGNNMDNRLSSSPRSNPPPSVVQSLSTQAPASASGDHLHIDSRATK